MIALAYVASVSLKALNELFTFNHIGFLLFQICVEIFELFLGIISVLLQSGEIVSVVVMFFLQILQLAFLFIYFSPPSGMATAI
jgi:hypothetical protein